MPSRVETQVSVSEEVGGLLMLRSTVNVLFQKIAKMSATHVIVDFEGVEFMSRSFADEYRLARARSSKRLEERHVPAGVARMFELVSDQVSAMQRDPLGRERAARRSPVVVL